MKNKMSRFFSKTPPFSWIYDFKWWFKYNFIEQYHIVKMPTLSKSYHDIDYRIVHANFSLLCEYVEKEMNRVCWDSDDEHKWVYKEIMDLYSYWKNFYPNIEKNNPIHKVEAPAITYVPHGEYFIMKNCGSEEEVKKWEEACKLSHEYELLMNKIEEDNLMRLIKIRNYLWS